MTEAALVNGTPLVLLIVAAVILLVVLLLARRGDWPFVVGGRRRVQEAEGRLSARERDLAAVARVSRAAGNARTSLDVARPLVGDVAELLGIGFAGVALVDDEGNEARGLYGISGGRPAAFWTDLRVDLRNEPSGISSAVFDAAPVTVFDVASSPLVSPRLAELVGARSGAWIPMIAEGRVIGVLVLASTIEKRAFTAEEISMLQAVAGEAALALDRIRSSEALAAALAREQALSEISRRIRAELDRDAVVRVAEAELRRATSLAEVMVDLGAPDGGEGTVPIEFHGRTIGVIRLGSSVPLTAGATILVEAVARELGAALHTAELFVERARQARVERGFYRIATLLGEPLALGEAVDAAAQAASEALGGDAAAVYLRGAGGLGLAGGHQLPGGVRELPVAAVLARVAADSQILAAPALADDERFDDAWRELPFAALVAIPVGGDTGGIVLVFFGEERILTADDLELARQLAQAARGALERSRLFEDERAARALSQRLAEAGALLATQLEPAAVLETVVQAAADLLFGDAAALAFADNGKLVTAAAAGDWQLDGDTAATAGLAAHVFETRATVVCVDAGAEKELVERESLLDAGFRAYLGVPLAAREDSLQGVLSVYAREPRVWREDEVQVFAALAANASSALANAELYQRVAVEREQSVAILANIADGIVAVDRDGHVVVWNEAAAAITGVPASEAFGRTTAQVLHRELASEDGVSNRLASIERGGEDVWISLSEAVMRDPSGAVAGRIFAFRDISAEHGVEQMKSAFVSTVSHELRTPLTSIYGFAQTLLREDVEFGEVEHRTFLSYIARETERLTAIVDVLLDAARLEEGRLEVAIRPTDVANVVAEVLSSVEVVGPELVAEVDDTRLRAQADPTKLRQVLDQLVSNALRYTPAGGTVTVSARRVDGGVELAVEDEGAGIPLAERERIFSKFYKAAGEPGGTGLGLFIAQGLVREMGGRIRVDDGGAGGSRFVFELPLAGEWDSEEKGMTVS